MKRDIIVNTIAALVLFAGAAFAQPGSANPVIPGGGGGTGTIGGTLGTTDNAIPRADGTGGVTAQGSLVTISDGSLVSESLTNGVLTSGTSWTQTGDFALAANAATYTHSAGSGTFSQTSAAGAIPWVYIGINGLFSFTYTTSAVTGAPVCTIPSTFALTAQTLTNAAGTYTLEFKAMATTVGDFKISCTSAAAATITFDSLSLKRVIGGDLATSGAIYASGNYTSGVPNFSSVNFPSTGLQIGSPGGTSQIGFIYGGVEKWRITTQLFPSTTDDMDLGLSNKIVKDVYLGRSIQGSKSLALTPASATTFVTVACPQTAGSNFCAGSVIYTVYETDGTDTTVLNGKAQFACANKAGTETCAAIADVQTAIVTTSGADTLTCAITAVTGLTDVIGLAANCTDAGTMTETTFKILYRLDMPQTNTVTPAT